MARQRQERRAESLARPRQLRFQRLLRQLPALGHWNHAIEGVFSENFRESRTHGGEGKRVACERASDAERP